jgi:hypothetical protein
MKKLVRRTGWLVAVAMVPLLLGFGSCKKKDLTPIIFVHGYSGSGAQFESQAMRFASNGYPTDYIAVIEYDSALTFPDEIEVVHGMIDAQIAEFQAELGVDQVVLMGHSRGTTVSHDYLSFPDRAANVAHYVNIDGRTADEPPGGVPTLALWAGAVYRPVQPELVGAINVTIPDQEHVEVATSEEAFFEMYQFLNGKEPLTTKILPQLVPEISGRVVIFPDNVGLDGATLEVWRVDGDTGERIGSEPRATYAIDSEGNFGPLKVLYGVSLEFAVLRDGDTDLNYFFEPFIRSDHLVRLNVALAIAGFIESSDDHVALTVVRNMEFWGDRGPENDVLAINGTDVINPVTAPSGAVGAASSAFFLFDVGSDGVDNLTSVPFPFPYLGFLTGADLFIPTDPPGTVAVVTVPRGDVDATRTVNVRNIPSTQSRVVVQLNDFEQ